MIAVGVVGHGKMGRGIVGLLADVGWETVVVVRDPAAAERGNRLLEARRRRGTVDGSKAGAGPAVPRQRFSTSLGDLGGCDLVIETVVEDATVKEQVLGRVEQAAGPRALVATNTSSLPVTQLARGLRRPEKFCGMHFFHPVGLTGIVEVIETPRTDPSTTDVVRRVVEGLGRRPLLVRDLAGSAINVMLSAYMCEAVYMLQEGSGGPSLIDRVAGRLGRLGPCEAMDSIGLSFLASALRRTLPMFPVFGEVPPLLQRLADAGREGRRAGSGIYGYREARPYDEELAFYREPGSRPAAERAVDERMLSDRLLMRVFHALLLLTALDLGAPDDLSLGIRDLLGLHDDPLTTMRAVGGNRLRERFLALQRAHGDRFDPSPIASALEALGQG